MTTETPDEIGMKHKSLPDLQLECALAETTCPNVFDQCDHPNGRVPLVPGLRNTEGHKRVQCVKHGRCVYFSGKSGYSALDCSGRGWEPVTSLSDAMVAVSLVFNNLVLQKYGEGEDWDCRMDYGHGVGRGETPDLAFWSALHEALQNDLR